MSAVTASEPKFVPAFLNDNDQTGIDDQIVGVCFLGNIYIPEETVLHILSYIDPKELLHLSLVCRKWNKLIKSFTVWAAMYKRKYNQNPKNLPWYLYYCVLSTNYFDTNLLANGNGQDEFNNWTIERGGGNNCIIEDPPAGADRLPLHVPEFSNKTSCFATSFRLLYKVQPIKLGNSELFQYILDSYKPHIYLSEWTAGRFDCGCIYKLQCGFEGLPQEFYRNHQKPYLVHRIAQWEGRAWEKVELIVSDYPEGINGIIFEHMGCDIQGWAGYYGVKMAGGVVKILFDSIDPLPVDEYGNRILKKFSNIRFSVNLNEEHPDDNVYLDSNENSFNYDDLDEDDDVDDDDYYNSDTYDNVEENLEDSFLPSFLNGENQTVDDNETGNGFYLQSTYIPKEIMLYILSYIDVKELLNYSLVCRNWNNLIKSYALWSVIYRRKYNRKPRQLPWYIYYCLLSTDYFDTNLLVNGNGQDIFNNWKIIENGGHEFIIEDPPAGANALPSNIPEFNNRTSCFATSFGLCYKIQTIKLGKGKLFHYILNSYKPHIYLSEWTAGRFDCGCMYRLQCGFEGKSRQFYHSDNKPFFEYREAQWEGRAWKKIELTVTEYPENIKAITFEHMGRDTQFWAGHYGSKMAGGVIKLLFDSLQPLAIDEHGFTKPKQFSTIQFSTNVQEYVEEILQ